MNENNTTTTILLINSLLILGLIVIQNETKDNINVQGNTNTSTTPIEFITWISIFFELILFLIQIKLSEI